MSVGLTRPLCRLLGFRSFLSATTLAIAGTTGWVFWPTTPPPVPAEVAVEDKFEGRVLLVPGDAPGSNMSLAEDFAYVDPTGKRWTAPAGLETDGASIPALLYPVVGHPFDSSYLRAAIVHDAACPSDFESWADAHLMFYHALLKCGLGETKAKVMYAAVYHFGPRWEISAPGAAGSTSPYDDNIVGRKLAAAAEAAGLAPAASPSAEAPGAPRPLEVRYDEKTKTLTAGLPDPALESAVRDELFDKCQKWIARENPSLEKIRDWTAGMGEPVP